MMSGQGKVGKVSEVKKALAIIRGAGEARCRAASPREWGEQLRSHQPKNHENHPYGREDPKRDFGISSFWAENDTLIHHTTMIMQQAKEIKSRWQAKQKKKRKKLS